MDGRALRVIQAQQVLHDWYFDLDEDQRFTLAEVEASNHDYTDALSAALSGGGDRTTDLSIEPTRFVQRAAFFLRIATLDAAQLSFGPEEIWALAVMAPAVYVKTEQNLQKLIETVDQIATLVDYAQVAKGATLAYGAHKAGFVVAARTIGLKTLPEKAKETLKNAFARIALKKGTGTAGDLTTDGIQRKALEGLDAETILKLSSNEKGNFAEIRTAVHLREKYGSGIKILNDSKLKKTLGERHGERGIDIAFEKDGIIYFVEAKWNRVGLKYLADKTTRQGSTKYIKRELELQDAVGDELADEILAGRKQFRSLVARVDSNQVVTMKYLNDKGLVDKTLPPFE